MFTRLEIYLEVRSMAVVIEKKFLDNVTLVTKTDNEFVNPMMAVNLHDMPKQRPPSHLHHRLRYCVGLYRNAGAEPSSKDNGLHMITSLTFEFCFGKVQAFFNYVERLRP